MMQGVKTIIAAGLVAGALSLGASAAAALPLVDTNVAVQADTTPKLDKVWYRCGWRRCYGRRWAYRPYYYRPYRYGYYYRPYWRRPFIGVGIGGIGVRLF